MTRPNHPQSVLIVARDQVIAALLGLLLETEGFRPLFAREGERAEDAIARLRPPVVIVLDGGLEQARSDLFFAKAARAGARVLLFAPPSPDASDAVREIARSRRLPFLELPTDGATLARLVLDAERGATG